MDLRKSCTFSLTLLEPLASSRSEEERPSRTLRLGKRLPNQVQFKPYVIKLPIPNSQFPIPNSQSKV